MDDHLIDTVIHYYQSNRRILPWREHITRFGVLVSEIMLQQTQVERVRVKFIEFMKRFPTLRSLERAPLTDVLRTWQGMGYNRRAKYLHKTAQIIVGAYRSRLPNDPDVLETLPGIGRATACAIACFAYNRPLVFIETNIRRVMIHHFFKDQDNIHDRDLLPVVERLLDRVLKRDVLTPREWYYALMDYGSHLATLVENPNKRSAHYLRQTKFEGSDRQVRGRLLRQYLQGSSVTFTTERERVLWDLLRHERLVEG